MHFCPSWPPQFLLSSLEKLWKTSIYVVKTVVFCSLINIDCIRINLPLFFVRIQYKIIILKIYLSWVKFENMAADLCSTKRVTFVMISSFVQKSQNCKKKMYSENLHCLKLCFHTGTVEVSDE